MHKDSQMLRSHIETFRSALDKVDWNKMPIGFRNFPRGTCGDISDILAEYLYKLGYTDISYICGENDQGTHAWLEIDGLAIDVTANQFEGIEDKIIMQGPDVWHSRFDERDRRPAGYMNMSGPAISGLIRVHNEILSKLNA